MNNIFQEMKDTAAALAAEFEAYAKRPTKASSKRLRALTNTIGKNGAEFRRTMIKTDKEK